MQNVIKYQNKDQYVSNHYIHGPTKLYDKLVIFFNH